MHKLFDGGNIVSLGSFLIEKYQKRKFPTCN